MYSTMMHLEAISIVSPQRNDNNICQNLKYIIAVNKLNLYVLIVSVRQYLKQFMIDQILITIIIKAILYNRVGRFFLF